MSGYDLIELLDRHKIRGAVRARIIRLNPDPKPFKRIRGYFRKPMSWRRVKKRLQNGIKPPERHPYRTPQGILDVLLNSAGLTYDSAVKYGWYGKAAQRALDEAPRERAVTTGGWMG